VQLSVIGTIEKVHAVLVMLQTQIDLPLANVNDSETHVMSIKDRAFILMVMNVITST